MSSLRDLFLEDLKDLYSAEQQIAKSLPKMADAASSSDLKNALEHHLEQTHGHIQRLERILEHQSIRGTGKKCEGMVGLLREGAVMLKAEAQPEVKDAGLIRAAQQVEHYEIAGYGTARTFAEHLGERDIADLLQETLEEEGAADKQLTEIAQRINVKAAGPHSGHFESESGGEAEDDEPQ